eukprot:TRINITY_DN20030_c0_g2_i1.p1 TRINITY_DN20030_c0_g2~~TRINITY_DN20030_c0_g2_i1.p1  ORF type:complete len:595 (+),score=111.83 TRINITY_DN20030_c0_g2_i1:54-1787(+)
MNPSRLRVGADIVGSSRRLCFRTQPAAVVGRGRLATGCRPAPLAAQPEEASALPARRAFSQCRQENFAAASKGGLQPRELAAATATAAVFAVAAAVGATSCGVASVCDETPPEPQPQLMSLHKAGSNSMRDTEYKRGCRLVDLSEFDRVEVDLDRMTATAGASVSMERLVRETWKHGVLPAVIPEFRAITVGGAVMGAALESSSGRFGEFSETCTAYRLRLGSGDEVRCSEVERPDLFDALPGSYGSLALMLSAEIALVHATPSLKVRYDWFDNLDEAIAALLLKVDKHAFVEGISFPEHRGHAIISADFDFGAADDAILTPLLRPDGPWFYEHVLAARAAGRSEERVSTEEYLHRHDRGAFWMARPEGDQPKRSFGGLVFGFLSSPPLRGWLDEYWSTTFLFRMLKRAPQRIVAENFLVTDVYADAKDAADLVRLARSGPYAIQTPIWLCPVRAPRRLQPFSPNGHRGSEDVVLIDVGLYGRIAGSRGVEAAKFFEQWGLQNNARKMLYSQNYYSKDEFWKKPMFDRSIYNDLRLKYGAEGRLVDLYTKVGNCEARLEASSADLSFRFWKLLADYT